MSEEVADVSEEVTDVFEQVARVSGQEPRVSGPVNRLFEVVLHLIGAASDRFEVDFGRLANANDVTEQVRELFEQVKRCSTPFVSRSGASG